jgi:hypothetical protein
MIGRVFRLGRRSAELARSRERKMATLLVQALAPSWRGRHREAGMATAEYAVGTVAAAAFAVVLYKIVTGGQVSSLVTSIVKRALTSLS